MNTLIILLLSLCGFLLYTGLKKVQSLVGWLQGRRAEQRGPAVDSHSSMVDRKQKGEAGRELDP